MRRAVQLREFAAPLVSEKNKYPSFFTKISKIWNYRTTLILLFIAVGIYRFTLIDRGALSIPDEMRYWDSGNALEQLIYNRDLAGFCSSVASRTNDLFGATDKPGDTLLKMMPAAAQGLLWKLSGGVHARDPQSSMIVSGLHVRNPESLKIVTSCNVIVSLIGLYFFYKITKLLFKGKDGYTFAGVMVYGLLANSNLYIRHILPYDWALLIFLGALYFILKKGAFSNPVLSIRSCALAGFLSAFGFSVYSGYYFFSVLIVMLMLADKKVPLFSKFNLFRLLAFGLSSVGVLLFFEAIFRIGGTSYLLNLKKHAAIITNGSFEDGFGFFPKYLFEVESYIGVFILVGFLFYILKMAVFLLKKRNSISNQSYSQYVHLFIMVMFCGFLFHLGLSLSRKMVFYGRLIHIYFPFMIWAMMAVLSDIRSTHLKNGFFYLIMPLLSLVSFLKFSTAYSQLAYPLDVLYQLGIQTDQIPLKNRIYESVPYHVAYNSPPPKNFKTGEPYRNKRDLLLVNFYYFHRLYPGDFQPFSPREGTKLIYQKPHFNGFSAYAYEGYFIEERKLFKDRNYQISVYEPI